MLLVLLENKEVTINLESFPNRLLAASDIERNHYEISPSGRGIHWPLIDEDISIDSN